MDLVGTRGDGRCVNNANPVRQQVDQTPGLDGRQRGGSMALNRRQFLTGGLGVAAASMGLTACGSGSGGGSSDGSADLQFAWWGNEVRNKNTAAAIAAYTKEHPKVKISQQPGEFATYWDKLATQTAGNKAPDIIQMDMSYI